MNNYFNGEKCNLFQENKGFFYMSISIFYLLDASFISAEKARWSFLSVRSAGKVKYSQFTEKSC